DWKAGTTGIDSAVPIAVLDTGIFGDHEDLQGKVTKSINFTSSSTAGDVKGHGTHVAGSVGALTDNGIGGGGGTCPGCVLYNVKVLGDDGSGTSSGIANGITWSSDNGAKVINMSLGGSGFSETVRDAVNYAWGKGVVVVAAAGNNGSSDKFYPAAYPNAIAVGATDSKDQKASYSNYGSWVDVAAPGSNILSTVIDNPSTTDVVEKYARWNGTSMATPHVAGVAGLVWSKDSKSGLCTDNLCVRTKIESSATDRTVLSATGPDWSKARINACSAVCAPPDTTAPTVSGVSPADVATGVEGTANATATFSEDMDPSTLTTSTITVVKDDGTTTPVDAAVTYDAATKKATLDPSAELEAGAKYVATVKTGVKDKAGNPLAADKTWSFTTASPTASNPDTTAPTVIAPSNLTATLGGKVSRPQISVKWTDNSTNETNFTVERSVDSGSTWQVLTSSLAANTTTYTDKTVQSGGRTYTYRVKATKDTESSAYSNTASATTK
ncbi:MAG: S8 family serine peptidase, partial [Actinomycetota bacterium]|nr:S8 family serine peptidase [Actinomycetota bacterium]